MDDDADLDDLVNHSRHLNLASSPTLDVLSAETREKIRRLQQLQGWASTALERRDVEMGMKTKRPLVQRTHGEVLFYYLKFISLVFVILFKKKKRKH